MAKGKGVWPRGRGCGGMAVEGFQIFKQARGCNDFLLQKKEVGEASI